MNYDRGPCCILDWLIHFRLWRLPFQYYFYIIQYYWIGKGELGGKYCCIYVPFSFYYVFFIRGVWPLKMWIGRHSLVTGTKNTTTPRKSIETWPCSWLGLLLRFRPKSTANCFSIFSLWIYWKVQYSSSFRWKLWISFNPAS